MPIGKYKSKPSDEISSPPRNLNYGSTDDGEEFDYMLYVDIIKQSIARTMIRGENLEKFNLVKGFFSHVCNAANCWGFLTGDYVHEELLVKYLGMNSVSYGDTSTFMLELVFNFKTLFYSDAGITPAIERKLIEQMVFSRTISVGDNTNSLIPSDYLRNLPSADEMYVLLNANKWLLPLAIVNASVPITTIDEIESILHKPSKRP